MRLDGGRAGATVRGEAPLPGAVNYLVGDDPRSWRRGIPTYDRVRYDEVYPGVDLVYHSARGALEFDFEVAVGADPALIGFRVDGADRLALDEDGNLNVQTGSGALRIARPVAYQEVGDQRVPVEANFILASASEAIRFELGAYDATRPLVIDPELSWSTYLGSADDQDAGLDIAVDAAGNAYVTGYTLSFDFPMTFGAFQDWPGGVTSDAFVTKIAADGSGLVYSTYLGGSVGADEGRGIAVDAAGSAYVTGLTFSSDFPTEAPILAWPGGTNSDAFVTKLSPSGDALSWSTYLGGNGNADAGYDIALDGAGNAFVTGSTVSADFPAVNAAIPWPGGSVGDGFVTKVLADGSALAYSTYLGSDDDADAALAIDVDAAGNAAVTGFTFSSDFPTASPIQTWPGGAMADGFVSRFTPAGALSFSTYLGGDNQGDEGHGVALGSDGDIYVTGVTLSADFPTVDPIFAWPAGAAGDAFVARLVPEPGAGSAGFAALLALTACYATRRRRTARSSTMGVELDSKSLRRPGAVRSWCIVGAPLAHERTPPCNCLTDC